MFPEAAAAGEESATSVQSCNSSITYPPYSNGGQDRGRGDDPVLTERDRKELMSLVNENISMDFILEMKEAFQLFDKVCLKNMSYIGILSIRGVWSMFDEIVV